MTSVQGRFPFIETQLRKISNTTAVLYSHNTVSFMEMDKSLIFLNFEAYGTL